MKRHKVYDGQVHHCHHTDPLGVSWDVGVGPKAELPAKMASKGRCRCSRQTRACVTPVPAAAMASAMLPTQYTGLRVILSGGARQIQAVKGPPWVMLMLPLMTALEALPPPAIRKKHSPMFWQPMGFLETGPSHDRDRASSEEDNDKAAGADNLG